MPTVQDILVLYQTTPALDAPPVAWAYYEASKGTGVQDLVEEYAGRNGRDVFGPRDAVSQCAHGRD